MRHTLNYLLKEGLISEDIGTKLRELEENRPISIFWHVRTLLYLGVTLLASGIGTLIYRNIDTIGHTALVIIVGLACIGCFYYSYSKGASYSNERNTEASTWVDYMVLLGSLLFLTFEGYLQYQYNIFGARYGLATIIPAIVLFFIAYRFDHLGVLTLGITLFATWLGISLTPKDLLAANDFSDERIVQSGLLLGFVLAGSSYLLEQKNIKRHFSFTYYNFAFHLSAIATLGAAFTFDFGPAWILIIIPIVYLGYKYAKANDSFYFLLCSLGYAYVSVSYLLIKGMFWAGDDFILWTYILMAYFIGSGLYTIKFLRKSYRSMKGDVGI